MNCATCERASSALTWDVPLCGPCVLAWESECYPHVEAAIAQCGPFPAPGDAERYAEAKRITARWAKSKRAGRAA